MSVIQATTSGFKDMADSTLRISFDIEPRYAAEAFALFGKRGSHVAIAALNLQASTAIAQQETIEADKPKGGQLSQWLALRCKEPEFWRFFSQTFDYQFERIGRHDLCDSAVKIQLKIESKTQIDNDKEAEARFHRMIRLPYQQWLLGMR